MSRRIRARLLAASTCSFVALAIAAPMLECTTFCSAEVRSDRIWSRVVAGLDAGLRDLAIE